MGIRTRGNSKAAALRRLEQEQFLDRYRKLAATMPRRCDTNQVGGAGECLACDAEQGEHCRLSTLVSQSSSLNP